jgi:hypothetical protein
LHLSPGYLKAEISLLDDVGAGETNEKGKKSATASTSDIARSKAVEFSEEFGAPSKTRT